MKRGEIRQAVAVHLGSIGYGHGTYNWVRAGRKVVCRVLTVPNAKLSLSADSPTASCWMDLPLPAGTSRKALFAALATVPNIGSPKAVKAWVETVQAAHPELIEHRSTRLN
jgi:hypothetical protein